MLLVAKKSIPQWQQQNLQYKRTHTQRKPQALTIHVAWKLKLFAILALCALSAIALISHNALVVDVNEQIRQTTAELHSLQEDSKHLKLQIATLRTPQRIEQKAYELGMQYPGREQLIILTATASE